MALVSSYIIVHPAPCQEKAGMVGVNTTSFIVGAVDVMASSAFSNHWSITGEASVTYKGFLKGKSNLEQEHDGEFSTPINLPESDDLISTRLLVSYWPIQTFRGPCIGIGILSGSIPDAILEGGYMFSVWKGLCISTTLRIPLIQSLTKEHFDSQNIRMGIHYKF